MIDSAERRANEKAEREAQEKTRRRAEQASIIEGLQKATEGDEHLLAFARGRISGGWRGKLNVGPEAFFAPFVNIGLTDRRVILQHIHPESGRPSEILPHYFALEEIASLTCTEIETFGGERACRIVLRFHNDQHCRVRLTGAENAENAEAMEEVFRSLTVSRHKSGVTPTQSVCPTCRHILDTVTKFCPYCGQLLAETSPVATDVGMTKGMANVGMPPMPDVEMPTLPLPPEEPVGPPTFPGPPGNPDRPMSAPPAIETNAVPADQTPHATPPATTETDAKYSWLSEATAPVENPAEASPAENAAEATAPAANASADVTTEFHVSEPFAAHEPVSPEMPIAPTASTEPISRYAVPAVPPAAETDTVAEAWEETPPKNNADSPPESQGENP